MTDEATKTEDYVIESEFGKGLCYCLGLFLAHADRGERDGSCIGCAEMWFNGAADHLFELQAESAPPEIRGRVSEFQDKCLAWRLCFDGPEATKEDKAWAIQEAKDLLLLIDQHNGVPVCKGSWE